MSKSTASKSDAIVCSFVSNMRAKRRQWQHYVNRATSFLHKLCRWDYVNKMNSVAVLHLLIKTVHFISFHRNIQLLSALWQFVSNICWLRLFWIFDLFMVTFFSLSRYIDFLYNLLCLMAIAIAIAGNEMVLRTGATHNMQNTVNER